jgi:hypothetical protein
MNVDWLRAGYLAGTIIRQGPVLIALLVGLVACVVARARLGAKAAWLGFAGFAILTIGQLLSATFPLALSLPGVRASQLMPIYSLLLVMIQTIGIGLLISALLSRVRPRPSPQVPPPQFRPPHHTWSMVIAGASGDGVGVNGPGAVRTSRRVIRRQMMP